MTRTPRQFAKYGGSGTERGAAFVKLASSNSKTVVGHLATRAPLLVQRALYPDGEHPGMAHLYLMSSSGGILQGDRFEIAVDAGEHTMTHITTQAATKIYRMNNGYASQAVTITAQGGSYIEFLPYQLIPFKSSRFYQDVRINVSTDSTVVYSETLSAGRVASGEKFDFEICFLRTTAYDLGTKVLFSDVCNIEPQGAQFEQLFGNKTIWSTTYIVTRNNHKRIDQEITDSITSLSMLAGCSKLPHDSGLIVRVLDDSIDKVFKLNEAIVQSVRRHALRSSL
ncbi:MAG: urease accessory protein UreD [Nitrososphaera sp.]|nr:urease accessory protein UreD [Nitrososphaera sp.]